MRSDVMWHSFGSAHTAIYESYHDKTFFVVCDQQRHRSDCISWDVQSDLWPWFAAWIAYLQKILYECLCFIEFICQVEEKRRM